MRLREFSLRKLVKKGLESFLTWVARRVTKYPVTVVVCSWVVVLVLGMGIFLTEFETRAEYLYSVKYMRGFKEFEDYIGLFGNGDRIQSVLVSTQDNILEKNTLLECFDLFQKYYTLETHQISFEDICARDYEEGPCNAASAFILFQNNRTLLEILPQETINQLIADNIHHFVSFVGGVSGEGTSITAHALFFTFVLKYASPGSQDEKDALVWEKALLDQAGRNPESGLEVAVLADRSINDESNRVIQQDSKLVAMSILLTFVYVSVCLGKKSIVHSKFILGTSCVLTVMGSLVAAYGICGYLGIKANLVSLLVIFILVGIGVDDMIVIVDAYTLTDPKLSIEDRIVESMKFSAAGIALTSVTDLVAFIISSVASMPVVAVFCITAGISVVVLFAFQLTFFTALMALDAKRAQANRMDCLPCIKLKRIRHEVEQKPGIVRNFITYYYAPTLMKPKVKILVVLAFAAFTGFAIYLSTNITVDSQLSKGLPDDSYISAYLVKVNKFFSSFLKNVAISNVSVGEQPYPCYLVVKDEDHSDPLVQEKMELLKSKMETNPNILPPVISWLDGLKAYASSQNATLLQSNFYELLEGYLEANKGMKKNFVFKQDGTIKASQMTTTFYQTYNATKSVEIMRDIRRDRDSIDLKGYAYSQWFIYGDRDSVMVSLVIQNLILAGVGVLVSLFFFLQPAVALLIGLMIVLVDVDLVGIVMGVWNVPLDVTAFLCLAMSVGLFVDYCAHVGIAYYHGKGNGDELVKQSLSSIGVSVLNGGLSTWLGISVLGFSNAGSFRVFFKMLFGVISLGLIHGMVLFPVLLSLIPTWITGAEQVEADLPELEFQVEQSEKPEKIEK